MAPCVEQNDDPGGFLTALEARAQRVETPCGECSMVWPIWSERGLPHPDLAAQEAVLRSVQPGTVFKVVARAGYWTMYERPEAFDPALESILDVPLRNLRQPAEGILRCGT
ncbi:MAG: hypothetical protein P8Y48_16140 [Novosphingobium sp.]